MVTGSLFYVPEARITYTNVREPISWAIHLKITAGRA
jgi:hypothetical protein